MDCLVQLKDTFKFRFNVHLTFKQLNLPWDMQSTFKYAAAKDWNSLPSELRDIFTLPF